MRVWHCATPALGLARVLGPPRSRAGGVCCCAVQLSCAAALLVVALLVCSPLHACSACSRVELHVMQVLCASSTASVVVRLHVLSVRIDQPTYMGLCLLVDVCMLPIIITTNSLRLIPLAGALLLAQ